MEPSLFFSTDTSDTYHQNWNLPVDSVKLVFTGVVTSLINCIKSEPLAMVFFKYPVPSFGWVVAMLTSPTVCQPSLASQLSNTTSGGGGVACNTRPSTPVTRSP